MREDEQFFAWLDGELSDEEAARVQARVATDPRLGKLADEHRALQVRLGRAFASVLNAPLPERLQGRTPATADNADNVVVFSAAKRPRAARHWPSAMQWAAMAATLVIGVVTGAVLPRQSSGPVEAGGGGLYAAGTLGKALDTQLASAPSGDVRIGLTFRDRSGAICRSFTGPQASGVACRADERWRLRGLFAAPEGQNDEYRMAAGMDPALATLIDATISGDPLDQAQERAAKQVQWH